MAHKSICKFNQSGFCKYQTHCRKQHIMDICPTSMCNNMSCLLRHPKVCKFFTNFRRCKFGESCAYLHGPDNQPGDVRINELEQELQIVKTKISEIETILLKLENIEDRIKSVEASNTKNCESIEDVKKTLDQKASQFEEMKTTSDQKNYKLDDLALNFSILMNAVDDLEKSSAQNKHHLNHLSEQLQNFQCHLCGQTYPSQQTLRNHIQRNHGTGKT